ncbi:MAG: hypothetical protein K8S55_03180 [Phycisphaerae bacterium]|nr:hypothetical protein [Phycisphaerae bacterium]
MSSETIAHIDFEPEFAAENLTPVEAGASTAIRGDGSPTARGNKILQCTSVGTDAAYVTRSLSHTITPGDWIQTGFYFRPIVFRQSSTYPYRARVFHLSASGTTYARLYLSYAGKMKLQINADSGYAWLTETSAININVLIYVVIAYKRATTNIACDGEAVLYFNGVAVSSLTGIDNYDRLATTLSSVLFGCISDNVDNAYDFDEVKIADNYPEPYVATPEILTPCPARTVVLYRQASADSQEFAYYCHSQLGVPLSNLCPLPNASANEVLADYATFQAEVETDLAAWLGRNPTVAANCTHFLIGYGVPGYFMHSGNRHSATARLMNYGTAFTGAIDNPLYQTTDRLTKTALAGKYLCTRIDAQNLAAAKTILDNSDADITVTATDKLYTDETAWAASLAAQKLRIETAAIPAQLTNDAFTFGDATSLSAFGSPAGSRVAFVDDTANSADTLRATSEAYDALAADYAAAMGFADTVETLDVEAFFEMLRSDGTFAEAMMVAANKIDGYLVTAGAGLFGVTFRQAGYNIYRGLTQDDMTLVAAPRSGVTEVDISQPGDTAYWYKITAVSAAGVEEHNTHVMCLADIDEADELQPSPLPVPVELTAELTAEDSLKLGFCWEIPPGYAQPTGFEVFSDSGSGTLDMENPVAVVSITAVDHLEHSAVVSFSTLPIQLAVRATRDAQAGPLSKTLIVPAAAPPLPPVTL